MPVNEICPGPPVNGGVRIFFCPKFCQVVVDKNGRLGAAECSRPLACPDESSYSLVVVGAVKADPTLRKGLMTTMTTGTIAPEDQERLEALIPRHINPAQYAQRDLGGINDVDMLRLARDEAINVLIEGPTGTGKSLVGEVFAATDEMPFLALPVNGGIDPGIVWGNWQVQPDRTLRWVDSAATLIFKYGGVLQYDECNMASASVNAAFHDVLSGARRLTLMEKGGEVLTAHPDLLMIGTMNPGYEGTMILNEAHSRRFDWQYHFAYDRSVEARLIRSKTLLDVAWELRDRDRHPEIRTDLATPTLQMVERTARLVGVAFALDRLVEKFAARERQGVRRSVEMLAPAIATDLGLSL